MLAMEIAAYVISKGEPIRLTNDDIFIKYLNESPYKELWSNVDPDIRIRFITRVADIVITNLKGHQAKSSVVSKPRGKGPTGLGSNSWNRAMLTAKDPRLRMSAQSSKNLGGIDLRPANMNLQTQNAGDAIKFHLDPAMLAQLQHVSGFVPVIINIQPMTNLRLFLDSR
jgi:hypothetical protein